MSESQSAPRGDAAGPPHLSAAYQRIQHLIADERCVILDGGVATELERVSPVGYRNPDQGLWGTAALYEAPYSVLQVHQRYVGVGCDVISTNTWAILQASEMEAESLLSRGGPLHWMDIARLGIRLGRQAIDEAGENRPGAPALFLTRAVHSPVHHGNNPLVDPRLPEESAAP